MRSIGAIDGSSGALVEGRGKWDRWDELQKGALRVMGTVLRDGSCGGLLIRREGT